MTPSREKKKKTKTPLTALHRRKHSGAGPLMQPIMKTRKPMAAEITPAVTTMKAAAVPSEAATVISAQSPRPSAADSRSSSSSRVVVVGKSR